MSLTLGRFVEFPWAAPSGIPQTSLGFRGHLITNFRNIMVLLIRTLNCPVSQDKVRKSCILSIILYTANSKQVVLRKSQTKA